MRMAENGRFKKLKLSAQLMVVIIILFVLNPGMVRASSEEEFTAPKTASHEYGFPYEPSQVSRGVVKTGQTLSGILRSHRVPYYKSHALGLKSRKVFDVRRLRAGNRYIIIQGSGSLSYPRYLIYEKNLSDYVVFRLEDPVDVFKGRKRVDVQIRQVSGAIETSLANALKGHPFTHELTLGLFEIFAWSIDFYHLHKGDYFKAIFEEEYVGDKPLRLGKILAAQFNHRGEGFCAFYFEQGARGRYYDENGKALQKAFLKSPLTYGRVTSGFSNRRLHPVLNRYREHIGIDYAAPAGTPIMTVGDGVILKTGYSRSKGKYVKVKHNGLYTSEYLHMSRFPRRVRPGIQVMQGDIIGFVGSTGLATGPHVEFRLFKNGSPVDPLKMEMPAGEPLKKDHIETFQRQVAELKASFDGIELAGESKPQ